MADSNTELTNGGQTSSLSQPPPQNSEQPSVPSSSTSTADQRVPAIASAPVQSQVIEPQFVGAGDVSNLNGISELQFDPSVNGFGMSDPSFMVPQIDFMSMPMMDMPTNQPISADEIALYDRQIRLWGVQAQEKIRGANILLIGLKGLGTEIAKNLVLAGVGTLTILEHEQVSEDDLGTQFFVTQEQIGQNRAQAAESEIKKLNPRVQLFIDMDAFYTKLPEYFMSFGITIATGLPLDAIASINSTCRSVGSKFYAADSHGMYGYIFADLGLHQFTIERDQVNVPTKPGTIETSTRMVLGIEEKIENGKKREVVLKQEEYSPFLLANVSSLPAQLTQTVSKRRKITPLLSCLRALFEFQQQTGRLPGPQPTDLATYAKLVKDKHLELMLPEETMKADFLRSFLQNLGSEISPVVAYLGGRLAQDVINVLGQREQPIQNTLLFDGETFTSPVYSLQPVLDADIAASMGMNVDMNGGAMAVDLSTNSALANGTATAA